MGYTHYFEQVNPVSKDKWQLTCDLFRQAMTLKILSGKPFPIQQEKDDSSPPYITKDEIVFNGIGNDAHETMFMERNSGHHFNFCKTNLKPYNFAVMVLLLIAYNVAPKAWEIQSDGDLSDWKPALDWVNSHLQLKGGFKMPPGIRVNV